MPKKPTKPAPKRLLTNKRVNQLTSLPKFSRIYMLACLGVLFVTTTFWSLLGASLQQSNADQLMNGYMFGSMDVFHGSIFPSSHSFLIKWPLFALLHLMGTSQNSLATITTITTLITVGAFAFILYRIERRPLMFGTLCLALASTLILVPAQPYAGGLLPVNMAMITTRNLEYIVFLLSLILLIKTRRFLSWQTLLGGALMSLLIASDRIFLSIGVGGALLALVTYAVTRKWKLVSLSVNWLLAGVVASVSGLMIIWIIGASKLTQFASQGGVSPYASVHSAHAIGLGTIYALLGFFTNFGANPAFDATQLKQILPHLTDRLLTISGPSYVLNSLMACAGIYVALWFLLATVRRKKFKGFTLDNPTKLSLALVWVTLAAFGVFIVSNHYYAVDERYLAVGFFAVFVCLATFLRKRRFQPAHIVIAGLCILLGVILAGPGVAQTYREDREALKDTNNRNARVAQILARHKVQTLVGDYWRVTPTKLATGNHQEILPLSGCTEPRGMLTSTEWQKDLSQTSFAYLLTLEKGLTDFPTCTLNQIIDKYGRPNSSTVIDGSLEHPKELLLFYDKGISKSSPTNTQDPATVIPINLDQLPNTNCNVPSVMNIMAHQDDDLLFTSPNLLHDIQAGHCIRTIYITAGDAGRDSFYWIGREKGSEAAYSTMLGTDAVWVERIVKLSDKQYITVANPKGNSKISLIFMHLPDGNMRGEGFGSSNHENLARLLNQSIPTIHSIDGQSEYSSDQLVNALSALMHTYQPAEIRTQSNDEGLFPPDHSDHMTVGRFVQRAYTQYEQNQFEGRVTIPITYYMGYPIANMPPNVFGTDLEQKQAAFLRYTTFDGGACHTREGCIRDPAYGAYLRRQYTNTH